MPFELAEVTSDSDFDELIPLLWRSYSAEPRITLLPLTFPADDDSAEAHEKQVARCKAVMMHMHHSDPSSHWLKVTDVKTGKIVAGCRWHVHEKDPYSDAPDKPFSIPFWPEGDRKKYAEKCVGAVVLPRKTRYRKPHLSLQVCFTDPDYRNRGAGRMMLEWGAKKADEMGLESFVEATPLGSLLNEKFGFITVSKELVDTHIPDASDEWKDMEARFPLLTINYMWRPIGGHYEEGKMSLPW